MVANQRAPKTGNAKEFDESLDQRIEEDDAYMQELQGWAID